MRKILFALLILLFANQSIAQQNLPINLMTYNIILGTAMKAMARMHGNIEKTMLKP